MLKRHSNSHGHKLISGMQYIIHELSSLKNKTEKALQIKLSEFSAYKQEVLSKLSHMQISLDSQMEKINLILKENDGLKRQLQLANAKLDEMSKNKNEELE
jgi:predicted nuclease with TOPRIM domain